MRLVTSITAALIMGAFTVNMAKTNSLNGTWCVGEEGFVLTFSGKDSLRVTSNTDESINAEGTYQKNDTSFTAKLINGDVSMKMKYRYRWVGSDSIKALAEQFTINDEQINSPTEWMYMVRCSSSSNTNTDSPKTGTVDSATKKTDKKQ